jgi:uncharacterized protein YecE (DUF72 family)
MARGRAYVGTSGWSYRHWRGPFYPQALPAKRQLDFYAERFDTVEVNGTFYRLIARETLAAWREQTPPGFLFACKASRFLTHMKRLTDCGQGLERYFERVSALDDKLGPIVFQLPAHFRPHPERLAEFLTCLPKGQRYTFEFRDPAWFTGEILELLRRHNVALCLYEFAGREAPLELTADFVYIRLHGPDGAYQGSYGQPALKTWAARIDRWMQDGCDVYCYFDNDQAGYAPQNALELTRLLGLGVPA